MTASTGPDTRRLGILIGAAGMLVFALNDVLGKWLVATYPPAQVVLLRGAAALGLLAILMIRSRTPLFPVERPGLQALRAFASSFEVVAFYAAVVTLPLADVMTYWLAAPIYVAALSPWLLGERVGPWRWGAILLGFVGVLLALQPGKIGSLSPAVLLSLAGSVAFAAMILLARVLRSTPDTALVFWQTLGSTVVAGVLAPFAWVATPALDFALISFLGIVALCGHLAITRALKLADAAAITPLQYTLLLWGILFGWLVFGDVPGLPVLLGGGLIILAGVVLVFREELARRRAGRSSPPTEASGPPRDLP